MDVITGDVYRQLKGGPHNMLIGLPFGTKTGRYALFIKPSLNAQFNQMRNMLFLRMNHY